LTLLPTSERVKAVEVDKGGLVKLSHSETFVANKVPALEAFTGTPTQGQVLATIFCGCQKLVAAARPQVCCPSWLKATQLANEKDRSLDCFQHGP
jgi:hypothetical protein